MKKNSQMPLSSLGENKGKDKHFLSEINTIKLYLLKVNATASMVSDATKIPQKNICRHKRGLQIKGLLWQTHKDYCKQTGKIAWYLTTDINYPNKII